MLLASANVKAETGLPQVDVGETYDYFYTQKMNCSSDYSSGSVESSSSRSYYINAKTSTELQTTMTKDSGEFAGESEVNFDLTHNILRFNFAETLEPTMTSNDIYFSAFQPEFIGNLTEVNVQLFFDLQGLRIRIGDDNLYPKANSVTFMGEPSIKDGADELYTDTRKWNISADFSSLMSVYHDKVVISKEVEYLESGVLHYSRINAQVKPKASAEICFNEEEYIYNSDPTSTPTKESPAFEMYFSLIFVPIVLLKKRVIINN